MHHASYTIGAGCSSCRPEVVLVGRWSGTRFRGGAGGMQRDPAIMQPPVLDLYFGCGRLQSRNAAAADRYPERTSAVGDKIWQSPFGNGERLAGMDSACDRIGSSVQVTA